MKTVHLVFNAHLDPIWLWSWRDGLDEILNTSHFICNLLDRHPDLIYTRGEAWLYEQIERVDPSLLDRIRAHVKAGRWSLAGGWYIQPDCNLPSGFAMERQIARGRAGFERLFGRWPLVGYNVDSFGHAATIPRFLHRAGQKYYVMMRPQENEMTLPARIFRWRGYEGDPAIPTFRIARAYCTPLGITEEHILAAASEMPEGVTHTMAFVGIGDHGGGPTEEMIAWCREHRDSFSGLRLEFSSPERFFAALEPELDKLPVVTGEMQQHAIGCFSVHRPVKTMLRRAEHRLLQAEKALGVHAGDPKLAGAWDRVLFHHFHDTLCGTCIPSAYTDIEAQLGQALAVADEESALALRRKLVATPGDPAQRLVFWNASDAAFDDFVEIEPWLEWTRWQPAWRLQNERGETFAPQIMEPEAVVDDTMRLLFPLRLAPGEMATLRIVESGNDALAPRHPVTVSGSTLTARESASVSLEGAGELSFHGAGKFPLPQLALFGDPSDTWSHHCDHFKREGEVLAARWEAGEVVDRGPRMASFLRRGTIGSSEILSEWRVFADRAWIELHLRIEWREKMSVLQLDWEMPGPIARRLDGIIGGSLERGTAERESPLRDWTRVDLGTTQTAIVAPDVFSVCGTDRRVSLTLLRSPLMAWHIPRGPESHRGIHSDRGLHPFRFRFLAAPKIEEAALDRMAIGWQQPPLHADWTRGMKNRAGRQAYVPGA